MRKAFWAKVVPNHVELGTTQAQRAAGLFRGGLGSDFG